MCEGHSNSRGHGRLQDHCVDGPGLGRGGCPAHHLGVGPGAILVETDVVAPGGADTPAVPEEEELEGLESAPWLHGNSFVLSSG